MNEAAQGPKPKRLAHSLREVAEALGGVSPGLLLLEAERGHIRVIRIGKRVLIPATELERLLRGDHYHQAYN
jgi:hypothetical protein